MRLYMGSTEGCSRPRSPGGPWHSVAVLLKIYAKCIDGQDQIAKRRIEDALREPEGGSTVAGGTDDRDKLNRIVR
jgi:hypothetical protein